VTIGFLRNLLASQRFEGHGSRVTRSSGEDRMRKSDDDRAKIAADRQLLQDLMDKVARDNPDADELRLQNIFVERALKDYT